MSDSTRASARHLLLENCISNLLILKIGLRVLKRVPGGPLHKRRVIYLHYNPTHKLHNDRMWDYFGNGFLY